MAEVRVKMESWVVARPIGFLSNAADSWASPCDSIKQFLDSLDLKGKFESFEALPPIWMTLHGRPTRQVHLIIGRNLKQPLFDAARR